MNSSKVLLGLLGGIAAGALAGILLSPDKGSKTRKKIFSKGKDFASDMKYKYEGLHDNVNKKYENLMNDTKKMAKKSEVK